MFIFLTFFEIYVIIYIENRKGDKLMGIQFLSSILALMTKEEVQEIMDEFHKLVEMADNGEFAISNSIQSDEPDSRDF